jgi:hypothetical protein
MNKTDPQARSRKNLKRPWTADDDAKLRALLTAGTSDALVAAKLKRTVRAVAAHCSKLGLSLTRRRRRT